MSDLHTDILCWLSLLGSIFTPRDFSSVIFFTVGEIGTHSWPQKAAKSDNNNIAKFMTMVKHLLKHLLIAPHIFQYLQRKKTAGNNIIMDLSEISEVCFVKTTYL